jgi:Fe-S oxidoreductase
MDEWHKGFRREIEYCTYCPKLCRFACPVAQVECTETVTPTSKMTVLKLVRDGVLPFDEEVGELVYACSGCLVSRTYCEHEIEVYPPFEAARMEAVNSGAAPKAAMEYADLWARRGNPFGADLKKTIEDRVPEKRRSSKAGIVLFAGCTAAHYFPEQIADTVKVLEALGVDFRVFIDDRICCGYPLLAMGHKEPFERQAERVAGALSGAELVLSPCPTCTHVLKNRYQKLGFSLSADVRHITEFAAENLDRIPIKDRETRAAIYHDPCHLGRYLGVYDEPRRILGAALAAPLIEFPESRDSGTCCGGGGVLPVTRARTARKISKEKTAQVPDLDAELIATGCPMCRRMLGRSGRDLNIAADDVISILSRCIQS